MQFWLSWWILCGCVWNSVNARLVLRDTQNIDNAKDKIRNKEGDHSDRTYKRSVIGQVIAARSLHYLFKGAKFIASNGLDSYYVKKGGSAKALEDFKSLNLNPKRRTIEGTEYLVGDIGNKMRVILSRDPFRKKYILTLGRPVRREVNSNIRTGYDEMGEKNIIYED